MLKDLLVVLIAIGVLLFCIGVIAIIKRKQGLSLFGDGKQQPRTRPSRQQFQRPIPPGFIEYLQETNQYDTRLRGQDDAIGYVLAGADDYTRALLYAYAVDCARHGRTMGNINREPELPRYRAFADNAIKSPEFLRSMARIGTWSYWNPSPNTNAYKMTALWFP